MNIYIGNLKQEITQQDLEDAFSAFGKVESAVLMKDKYSNVSRGFGFVEMPAKAEALAAIDGIKDLKGQMVVVNEARPRMDSRGGNRGSGGKREGFGGRGSW